MFNVNQYTKDKSHRAQLLQEAEQLHLAKRVQGNQRMTFNTIFYNKYKTIIAVSLVIIVILFLILILSIM
jgi:hypothetical protein